VRGAVGPGRRLCAGPRIDADLREAVVGTGAGGAVEEGIADEIRPPPVIVRDAPAVFRKDGSSTGPAARPVS